jgi:hypothetical protein
MHPQLYELDHVNTVIRENHRDALQHEQTRRAHSVQPNRVTSIILTMRASVATALAGTRTRIDTDRAADAMPVAEQR